MTKSTIGVWALCALALSASAGEAYRFYRFKVEATRGDALQIAELKFFSGKDEVTRAFTKVTYDRTTKAPNGYSVRETYEPTRALDGDLKTKWYDDRAIAPETMGSVWLTLEAPQPVDVTRYEWYVADDTQTYPNRNPAAWRFQASTDGRSWTDLDVVREGNPVVRNFARAYIWERGVTRKVVKATSLVTHDGRRLVTRDMAGVPFTSAVPIKELPASLPPARPWTIYVFKTAHVDLGLHTSTYNVAAATVQRMKLAKKLIEEDNAADADPGAFRWFVEGWYGWRHWANLVPEEARAFAVEMSRRGRFSCGVGCAGNYTELFGYEELFRSLDGWADARRDGFDNHTLFMTDLNGIGWGVVGPYAKAGIRNIGWWPNHWHQTEPARLAFGTPANGRPLVFWWEAPDRAQRILVWSSPHSYCAGGIFGAPTGIWDVPSHPYPPAAEKALRNYRFDLRRMERATAKTLADLERVVPYDIWAYPDYLDDELPNLRAVEAVRAFNAKWRWPQFRTVGNLDEPFDALAKKWGDKLPVVRGQITSAWVQLCLGYPVFHARKFNADRLLPAAEAEAAIRAVETGAAYPKADFDHAWESILKCNEHGMGGDVLAGYVDRRVWETWLQNFEWLDFAERVAKRNLASVPAPVRRETASVENRWYRLKVNARGEIESIYDKDLQRELLSAPAGRLVYSPDNNATFVDEKASGAAVTRRVTLAENEKAIYLEVTIEHPWDVWKKEGGREDPWKFGYVAFPFALKDYRFAAQINGPVIDPIKDIAPYTTDAYLAVRDWCAVEGEGIGVGLALRDTTLVEFGRVHPKTMMWDRTAESSALYSYVFNSIGHLAEVPRCEDFKLTLRYAITSYRGDWRTADLPAFAARFVEPEMERVRTRLKTDAKNVRLVSFRRSEEGWVARFRETEGRATTAKVVQDLFPGVSPTVSLTPFGFATVTLGKGPVTLASGEAWNGLVYQPRANWGGTGDLMYLQWAWEKGVDEYTVYRAETPDVPCDAAHQVAKVVREAPFGVDYLVGRYEDHGLRPATRYWYRLRSSKGAETAFTAPFGAMTRQKR